VSEGRFKLKWMGYGMGMGWGKSMIRSWNALQVTGRSE
jgi:hypothetical protein